MRSAQAKEAHKETPLTEVLRMPCSIYRKIRSMDLPANSGPARTKAIFEAICDGHFEVEWAEITSTFNGHTATFYVFADALKIDGVRVNVSAELEQRIADRLGCMLLTPKLADLIYEQAERTGIILLPHVISEWRGANAPCSTLTADMLTHSAKIDEDLVGKDVFGKVIATLGKHWVLDNDLQVHPGRAMNYGWYLPGTETHWKGIPLEIWATLAKVSGLYRRIIQGKGTQHGLGQDDYSQICVLASFYCLVDGQASDLRTVLQDPQLAGLANHGGVLHMLRQPGVPEEPAGTIIMPEIRITA